MSGKIKTRDWIPFEFDVLERRFNRQLTPEERKFLELAGTLGNSLEMRRLEPVFTTSSYPEYWKCSDCQKVFRRPGDVLDRTAHFPPVATLLEFEQHSCPISKAVPALTKTK